MKFAYQAVDGAGKVVGGTIDAADENEAMDALRHKGLFVGELRPATGDASAAAAAAAARSKRGKRLSTGRRLKNMAMFTRQLTVLVSSGTPLVQALLALERQTKDVAWRDIISGVRAKVEQGSTLSEAMSDYPHVFDAIARSLVSAGESGGGFETMLDRLAVLSRKQLHLRSAIVGAMIYPALLIVVAIGVLALMLLFVLPRFAGLFDTLDVKLPAMTQFLMACSDFLRSYWWTLPIAAGAAFVATR
jgi:general secretion pathway protein F